MTAAVSTHVTITDKVPNSNKCPLKISLIGISQEMPVEIKNTQDSVVKTLISDYVSHTHFAVKNKEHVSAELPSMNPMQSKLLNVHRNVTNKFEDHNQLKRKNEEVDAENAEDDNVDDAENAEDNNVDDIEEHQPKAEKFVRENPNSETNIKGKKSSSKTKKHSMRNSKK
ncbi:20116_t:CDS:2, partial [Gigaspora rosea]